MKSKFIHRIIICFLVAAGCIKSLFSFAQNDAAIIQRQFNSYQTNNYNEKVFVHTDKTFYLTGESIWFKIYCVDEQLHKPSVISKIVYVEINNNENKPVMQAKIALNDGGGNGSFIIPSFIATGNYTLRAYTKWMMNFDADFFYHQTITVFNNLKPGVAPQQIQQKNHNVSFFPEGGNLVAGIASKIAFKAIGELGKPVDCSGYITDSHNNHITDFTTLKFGMGSFDFTPQSSETYNAVIKIADTTLNVRLPLIYAKGYVMHLADAGDNQIKVSITSNMQVDEVMYMLAHSQNLMKDFQQLKLNNGKAEFNIDKSKLADGVNGITIFNSARQPVCERLYFKQPINKLNIKIQPDKNTYQTKQQVNISLSTNTNANQTTVADMSVAVFMIDSLQPSSYNDILSYFLLSSELKGSITSPEYYFQTNNKDVAEATDNLMLTQGWRRFNWEDVLNNKKPYFEFIPEAEDIIVSGKIINKNNGTAGKDISATLTVVGKNFQLSNATSDDSGRINFSVKNFYGDNTIVLQTDSNYNIQLASSFSNKFVTSTSTAFTLSARYKQQLLYRSINTQADNAYLVDKKQRSYVYNIEDTSLFYGKPDKRYNLDDYIRYTTMEEVMREYVQEVRVRKESGQYHFKVVDYDTKSFQDNDPLILVDGMPVAGTDAIMQFSPLKVKSIDVVGRRYHYGNTISDGILNFSTYDGDLGDYPLNSGMIMMQYEGLQRQREFYSPSYDSMQTHIPDFRNVLFWSPSIKTGADGKATFSFYTSEIKGNFACVVQGITPDGKAGSTIITFDVGY